MKIEKEGLHTYRVETSVQNEYFLAVEYQTIWYNHPDTLLPMLIREQDGVVKLLYDISESRSLAELSQENNSHGNNFSKEDCRCLLRSTRQLLKDLEELMLSPVHISYSPECIYRTGEREFRWMYCPDEEYDMGQEVQQFFSWMLSEINYGDSATVRYIYHVYWLMRNRSFSEKLIRECLDYKDDAPEITSYESFFAQEISRQNSAPDIKPEIENPKKPPEERGATVGEGEQRSGRILAGQQTAVCQKEQKIGRQTDQPEGGWRREWLLVSEVLLAVAAVLTGTITVAMGVYLFWQGQLPFKNRYWIGVTIGAVLLAEGVFQIHRRRNGKKQRNEENTNGKQKRYDTEAASWNWSTPPLSRDIGEVENGTVRLDAGALKRQAVLKSEESGELFSLQSFPFYIGNDKGLNQLTIYDETVSRKHAVIERGALPGIYLLKDLQSTNGTWVNHIRVERDAVELKEGDVVQFAVHSYRFEISEDFVSVI